MNVCIKDRYYRTILVKVIWKTTVKFSDFIKIINS